MLKDKEFFANHVHSNIVYQDIEKSLQKYQRRMDNELKLRDLDFSYFKGKTVLDIGTGFQAIIASKMGAKHVYHLDISSTQIEWMKKYCKVNSITNIDSLLSDITKEIPLEDNTIDVALIFGVYHHLHTPADFMTHLLPKLKRDKSEVFLRMYRAGTWSRWLVYQLRALVKDIDIECFKTSLHVRYPLAIYNQYKGDLLDDLYAPIWKVFSPSQFNIAGVSSFLEDTTQEINFDDIDENFRVNLHVDKDNYSALKNHTFSNNFITYNSDDFYKKYPKIENIEALFNNYKQKNKNSYIAANEIITLYELVRKSSPYDIYSHSNYTIQQSPTYTSRITTLYLLLSSFTKDTSCTS